MDEHDYASPMQMLFQQDPDPNPVSDSIARNILTKVTENITDIAGTVRTLTQVLEVSKHDQGQKSQQRTANSSTSQNKLESLEEESRILRGRVASLVETLQSEKRKTQDLHKMMIKADGNTTAAPNDPQIQAGFEKLRDEIYPLVKRHFIVSHEKFSPTASSDAPELINRAAIATKLYECFFDKQSYVFGVWTELEQGLARFEREMLNYGNGAEVELDEVFERRARTVQICQRLKIAGKQNRVNWAVNQVWSHVGALCRYRKGEEAPAVKDLEALCESALDLAILLRSTTIEFDWEQKPQCAASVSEEKNVEVLGTLGPDMDKGEDYTIDRVVFGGLVRGDAKTGRFTDGRVRLLKSNVLIA